MTGTFAGPSTAQERLLLEVIAEMEAEPTLPQKAAVWASMVGLFTGAAAARLGMSEDRALTFVLKTMRKRMRDAKRDPRLKTPSKAH